MTFSSDRRASNGCQLTIQSAFEYAESAFLFIQHCCIFVFFFVPFSFRSNVPLVLFFHEICDRIDNEMSRKRKCWSRKGGLKWTKKRCGHEQLVIAKNKITSVRGDVKKNSPVKKKRDEQFLPNTLTVNNSSNRWGKQSCQFVFWKF